MSESTGNIHQASQRKIPRVNNHSIHALIAAYFNLMSKLNGIQAFSHHVDEVRIKENLIRNLLAQYIFLGKKTSWFKVVTRSFLYLELLRFL